MQAGMESHPSITRREIQKNWEPHVYGWHGNGLNAVLSAFMDKQPPERAEGFKKSRWLRISKLSLLMQNSLRKENGEYAGKRMPLKARKGNLWPLLESPSLATLAM